MSRIGVYKGYAEAFRFQLAGEQNWRCCYCGVEMARFRNVPELCTTEHVIPKACGGQLRWETCAAACKRCNTERGRAILEMLNLPISVKFCPRCGSLPRKTGRAWRCDQCLTNFSLETPTAGLPFTNVPFWALIRTAGEMLVTTSAPAYIAFMLKRDVFRYDFAGKIGDSAIALVSDTVATVRATYIDDPVEAYREIERVLLELYTSKRVNPPRGGFPRTRDSKVSSDIFSSRWFSPPPALPLTYRGRIAPTGQSIFGKTETCQAGKSS
jgi:hypothetical protein